MRRDQLPRMCDSAGHISFEINARLNHECDPENHGSDTETHDLRSRTNSYRFIASKNSELVLVSFILSSRNSIAASSSMGCSSLRRIHILASSVGSVIRSSLRVPERLMFTAGNTRFSAVRLARWISQLPVPLHSP